MLWQNLVIFRIQLFQGTSNTFLSIFHSTQGIIALTGIHRLATDDAWGIIALKGIQRLAAGHLQGIIALKKIQRLSAGNNQEIKHLKEYRDLLQVTLRGYST